MHTKKKMTTGILADGEHRQRSSHTQRGYLPHALLAPRTWRLARTNTITPQQPHAILQPRSGYWPGGRAKSGHQAYRRARFQLERAGAGTVGAESERSERAPTTSIGTSRLPPVLTPPPSRVDGCGASAGLSLATTETVTSEST